MFISLGECTLVAQHAEKFRAAFQGVMLSKRLSIDFQRLFTSQDSMTIYEITQLVTGINPAFRQQ